MKSKYWFLCIVLFLFGAIFFSPRPISFMDMTLIFVFEWALFFLGHSIGRSQTYGVPILLTAIPDGDYTYRGQATVDGIVFIVVEPAGKPGQYLVCTSLGFSPRLMPRFSARFSYRTGTVAFEPHLSACAEKGSK